jgi:hypothetical protein
MKLSIQAIAVLFLHIVLLHHGAFVMAMDSAAQPAASLDQVAGMDHQNAIDQPVVGVEDKVVAEPAAHKDKVVSHNVRSRHVQSCPAVSYTNAPTRSNCYSRLATLGCSAACTKTGSVSTNPYGVQVWSCWCSPP